MFSQVQLLDPDFCYCSFVILSMGINQNKQYIIIIVQNILLQLYDIRQFIMFSPYSTFSGGIVRQKKECIDMPVVLSVGLICTDQRRKRSTSFNIRTAYFNFFRARKNNKIECTPQLLIIICFCKIEPSGSQIIENIAPPTSLILYKTPNRVTFELYRTKRILITQKLFYVLKLT